MAALPSCLGALMLWSVAEAAPVVELVLEEPALGSIQEKCKAALLWDKANEAASRFVGLTFQKWEETWLLPRFPFIWQRFKCSHANLLVCADIYLGAVSGFPQWKSFSSWPPFNLIRRKVHVHCPFSRWPAELIWSFLTQLSVFFCFVFFSFCQWQACILWFLLQLFMNLQSGRGQTSPLLVFFHPLGWKMI